MTSTPLGAAVNDPNNEEEKLRQIREQVENQQQGTFDAYDPETYGKEEEAQTEAMNPSVPDPEEEQPPEGAEYADDPNIEYINGKPFYKKEAQKAAAEAEVGRSVQQTSDRIGYAGSAAALGMVDFGMDLIGNAPGGESIDDWYDEATKFKRNPNLQKAREAMSVIVPTAAAAMTLGPAAGAAAARVTGGSAIAKGVAALGVTTAADVAVTYNADLSERDETLATGIGKWLDDMGNPLGMNIPDAMRTMDDDSPEVRTQKNTLESAGLSIIGDALGYVLKGAMRPPMQWFKPENKAAAVYKDSQIKMNMDPETLAEVARLDKVTTDINTRIDMMGPATARLQTLNALTPNELNAVTSQMDRLGQARKAAGEKEVSLINEYVETGKSSVTSDPLEAYVEQQSKTRQWQIDDSAAAKINESAETGEFKFDPDVSSELVPEASTARQSIPKGNIARNKADITSIQSGTSKGSPAPIISEPMMRKGFTEDSREVIADLNASDEMTGNFKAVIDGNEFDKAKMDSASQDLYRQIMDSRDPEEINELLLTKLDLDEISKLSVGSRQAARALEEDSQTRAMAFALRDLTDKYLSQEVNLQSARAIKTLSSEVSDIARAGDMFEGVVDPNRIDNLVLDKVQFLMQEYGISKYVWGWSGNNKKWWEKFQSAAPDKQATMAVEMKQTMEAGIQERKIRAQNYRAMFEKLKQEGDLPFARAITKAYDWSNGEIDSVAKLNAWVEQQMSPMGMLYSKDKDLNMFTDGIKSVIYNNVLSGKAALNAFKGNVSSTILQPINGMIGAGIEAVTMKSIEPIKRGLYAYGAVWSTQQRALQTGIDVFKQASDDPVKFMDRLRTDYQFGDPDRWDILDSAIERYREEGNTGKQIMYSWMKFNQGLSMHALPRWGINAMLGIDAATGINQATIASRFKAWDETFTKLGDYNPKTLQVAEDIHYANIFDKNDVIKDEYVKYTTSEIALNADDDVASGLTALTSKIPALTPFLMFPKTGINAIKQAMSYTPLSLMGFGKYGRVLTAKTDEQISEALASVGITTFAQDPAMGRLMHRNLKNEYMGRMVMGSALIMGSMQYALAGNIRGHGDHNPAAMRRLRTNHPDWKPKTIKVLGSWVSYEGIPGLDPLLAMVGDMAYYGNSMSSSMTEDWTRKLGFSFLEAFGDKAGMRGLEPLFQLAKGDEYALNRFFAQEARKAIPMSGALGVLANLDDTHKDIYGDFKGYLMNTLPGMKQMLPDHVDYWTGKPINDVDAPMLKMFNALSPIKISEAQEDWRKWLMQSGWQGGQMLRRDPDGVHSYSGEEREQIVKLVGEEQLWVHIAGGKLPNGKVIRPESALMYNKDFNEQIEKIRTFRAGGMKWEQLQLEMHKLPVYKYLDTILKDAQAKAQAKYFAANPGLATKIQAQKIVEDSLKKGDVSHAIGLGNTKEKELKQLLQFK